MANDILNQVVSYGLQNGKKKDEILAALLKSGKVDVSTAVTALKGLGDMGAFDSQDPNADPLAIDRSGLTSVQNQAYNFGTRTLESGKTINNLESNIAGKGFGDSIGQSIQEKLVGTTLGQRFVSPEFQKFDQAKRDFINAVLRRESGAVISPEEFDNATKQYFPVPGEDPATTEQKRKNRELVTKNLLGEAGVKTDSLNLSLDKNTQQTDQVVPGFQEAMDFARQNPNDPNSQKLIQALRNGEVDPITGQKKTIQTNQSQTQPEQKTDVIGTLGKIGEGVGSFLGGDEIGKAIGNMMGGFIAKHGEAGQNFQDTLTKYVELKQKGTIDENQFNKLVDNLDKTAKSAFGYDGPSFKQIAGDALQAGLTVGTMALPGAGSLVGKVAQGAATGYGFDVASGLQNKDKSTGEAFIPGAGTAVGGALPVIGKAFSLGSSGVKQIASYLSGVPAEAIDEAFKNPQGVKEAIKTYVNNDDMKMQIVQNAKEGLDKIASARSATYETALKEIKGTADNTLSTQAVKDSIKNTLGNFNIVSNGSKLDFTQSALPKAQQSKLAEVIQRINTWKDTTPLGMNQLRKVIDSYNVGSAESKSFDKIIQTLKGTVKDQLESAVPAIADMNKKYASESELIKLITKELSLGKDVSPTTALNKLTSIFNKNGEFKEKLVRQLGDQEGQKLLDEIVGSMFTDWMPRGLSARIITGLGGAALTGAGVAGVGTALPAIAAGVPLASPRVIGSVATTAGKVSQNMQKLPVEELKKLSRTALLDLITKYQKQ